MGMYPGPPGAVTTWLAGHWWPPLRGAWLRALGAGGGRRRGPARAGKGQLPRSPAAEFLCLPNRRARRRTGVGAQGVGVLGASNYYDFGVYEPFAERSTRLGFFLCSAWRWCASRKIFVRPATGSMTPANPGKTYLCGKGITQFAPMNAAAAGPDGHGPVDRLRPHSGHDRQAQPHICAAGVETSVTEGSIKAAVVSRYGVPADSCTCKNATWLKGSKRRCSSPCRPGAVPGALARVLGTGPGDLDAVSVQNAIRYPSDEGRQAGLRRRDLCGPRPRLPVGPGARAACPATRSWPTGHNPCASSSTGRAPGGSLRQHRVHCAELIPNRNAVPVLRAYVRALREAGIAVLAGTEHNTLDMVPMEPHCAGGAPVPEDLKDIFWEGACVIAAHQFLTANGKSGYVDALRRAGPDLLGRRTPA